MNRAKRIADILNVIMISLTILTPIICIGDTILSETGLGADGEIIVEAANFPSPSYTLFMGRFYLLGIGILIIMLTSYFSRVLIEKFWLYTLVHIGLVVLSIMSFSLSSAGIIHISFSVIFAILSGIVLFVDVMFWQGAINEEKNLPVSESGTTIEGFKPIFKEGIAYIPTVFVVVYVAALIYASWRSDIISITDNSLYKLFYIFGIVFIMLSYLRSYLRNLSDFIGRDKGGKHTPIREMIIASVKLTVPLILIVVVAMVLFQSDSLISFIDTSLKKIAEWIAGLISRIMQSVSKASETEVMMEVEQRNMERGPISADPVPLWLDRLFDIMERVVTITVSIAIAYAMLRGILHFLSTSQNRSINKLNNDKLESMTEVRERVGADKKKRSKKRRAITPAEKIREMYRKYMQGMIKKGYSYVESDTPFETAGRLVNITQHGSDSMSDGTAKGKKANAYVGAIKDKDTMVNITQIYNRARYNDKSVTDKELAKFKEIM